MDERSGFVGNDLFLILLLFFLFSGGNGWGNSWEGRGSSYLQNSLTRAEMADGFTTQNIQNDLKTINSGLVDGFGHINQNLNNGFFESQKCCCETNRNIDAVRYENSQNTCAITTAIREDGEKTRALLTAQQIQDLRDRLAEKDNLLQSANLTLANAAQTQNILSVTGRYVPYAGCGSCFNPAGF